MVGIGGRGRHPRIGILVNARHHRADGTKHAAQKAQPPQGKWSGGAALRVCMRSAPDARIRCISHGEARWLHQRSNHFLI